MGEKIYSHTIKLTRQDVLTALPEGFWDLLEELSALDRLVPEDFREEARTR